MKSNLPLLKQILAAAIYNQTKTPCFNIGSEAHSFFVLLFFIMNSTATTNIYQKSAQ